MSKKLSLKQQKFADEYIITGNSEQAAIKAGYSKSYARGNAHKLVAKVSVKNYIDERLEEIKSERVADQQEVMEYLTSVMRGEVEDEQFLVVGDGELGSSVERHNKRSDTNDRTKAAELLGKRYVMWTDKQQVENITPVFVEDVPDED
ncbi:terminase small subunit [Halobacillus massiliensis]|uniref:terminase small subunit n=1 Tax=Halobacillus massiliensis TaxID=1926286 RepID=UPI0009E579CE|nr:terminase small subunit [Halobacillus massiliensis]